MREQLDAVLDQFRAGFDADGFDVAVDAVEPGGVVVVRVGHRPNCCEECLIPDDMLSGMLRMAMQKVAADVTRVDIKHEHLT